MAEADDKNQGGEECMLWGEKASLLNFDRKELNAAFE